MADKQRNKPQDKVRGLHKAQDITYNEQAGAVKVLGPIVGQLKNLGLAPVVSTAISFPSGSLLALYNNTAATEFFQTDSVAIGVAPAAATGIALKPNDYTIIAIPADHSFFRSSSASVIVYLVADDSYLG